MMLLLLLLFLVLLLVLPIKAMPTNRAIHLGFAPAIDTLLMENMVAGGYSYFLFLLILA